MDAPHPERALLAYLRNELAPDERARVDAHLAACAACRASLDAFAALVAGLAESAPAAPAPDWVRYAAEVRARVARPAPSRWWTERLAPLALAGALGAGLVLLALGVPTPPTAVPTARPARPLLAADTSSAVAARLGLLEQYPVIERLDLLENLDLIRDLDRVSTGDARQG